MEEALYVWIFPPAATQPVLCGLLQSLENGSTRFSYGKQYAARPDALSLAPGYPLDAALRGEWLEPLSRESLPTPLDDVAPGRWGEFVLHKRLGRAPRPLESLMLTGPARLGALAFSPARDTLPQCGSEGVLPLSELPLLAQAVAGIERTGTVPEPYRYALQHGPSVGGRRPKADFVDEQGQLWIAKFTSAMDVIEDQPRLEAFGLAMAQACQIEVAPFRVVEVAGRPVLLVQRFDRRPTGERDHVISARTVLAIPEASLDLDASYPAIGEYLRRMGLPAAAAAQWFDRMVFNIVIGNTDDHALNHLFRWDGRALSLMPAFDLEPCGDRDQRRHQMKITPDSHTGSLANALVAAAEFGLSTRQAQKRIDAIRRCIVRDWRGIVRQMQCGDATTGLIQSGLRLD